MIDDPSTAAAIELVLASLTRDHPDRAAGAAELRRRWERAEHASELRDTAVERAGDGFTRLDPATAQRAASAAGYDPADLEPARAYLGALTLIYERWVLQEAEVEPENLYATPEHTARVHDVLHREATRHETHLENGAPVPDPLGAGAWYLSRAVELALFAAPDQLHDQLLRWAGSLHEDSLREQRLLCSEALPRLHGPWALEHALAGPGLGKDYHRPHQSTGTPVVTGFDIALGRPGLPAADAEAELATARQAVRAELAAEIARLTGTTALQDGSTAAQPEAGSLADTAGNHVAGFFTAALAVTRIAADDLMRVDGRPVPGDMRGHVLSEHYAAGPWHEMITSKPDVAVQRALPSTTITVAGLTIDFRPDANARVEMHELNAAGTMTTRFDLARPVVAEINAAGVSARFDFRRLHGLLDVLGSPDAVARIARYAVHRAIHTTAATAIGSMGQRPTITVPPGQTSSHQRRR
ncbi:hypothetical protein ALI22I_01920 [Saccharothrix sp. ALI-22-I]|uniref:hypothetical protein n=1 Tax=Saccharothrix sp. ALI-22-I TaxID=1933778 RepID=UPI00097C7160|nr:hypothetical protein [Saccharothrix sp. ALI-22-I]ONI92807.1 hypothetical protein ALI22I_01920 [Saccharothrix sp. ALI-22-I]